MLSPESPQGKHLKECIGKTIITSDGNTLLGADDKTGCTVLVSLICNLLYGKPFEHGDLYFVFSQNEDIGRAADGFETKYVGGNPDVVIDVDVKVRKHVANAYRLVFHGQTSLFDAINQIKDQVPDGEEVRNIIKFLESTEKGVITKM